jgi:hypothetical protein
MKRLNWFIVGLALLLAPTRGADAQSTAFPAATPPKQPPATPAQKVLDAGSSQGSSTKRATRDIAGDLPGYHIHVMYVIPSDGADKTLDTNGTIATSVAAIQRWFVNQTGGARSLRFDTNHGELDVAFFRLSQTDAEIASAGAFVRDRIEEQLKAAGFNHPRKIYAVYYGGSSRVACGGGAWPPKLIGNVAALYLEGTPPLAPPCSKNPFAATADKPGYFEFSLVHEIFHVLGAVATCAPHHTLQGHVSDGPNDLMYAGPLPWKPSVLDINNDDYFGHQNADCLDVAKSVFVDPVAKGAVAPPGWKNAGTKPR